MKTKTKNTIKASPKTFMKEHHWIENPVKTAIAVCSCGNKYIKTRPGQKLCIKCIYSVKK